MANSNPIHVGDYSFTILVEPNDPDGYLVTCPALPGVITQGDTLDEAYEMAHDAIQVYIESLIADGQPIPHDKITMPVRVTIDNDKIAA
ncbi:MAG: type II toxin-antitoxin system HicB family antitoxin [Blastocatellia bacterium]|nr:type II toxin-antitoxin system HicB family antitoxin [Blastocatellia bacterium]